MSQRWTKLGLLYAPPAQALHTQLVSHAANPLPVHLDGDVYRVFYSGRDVRNRSSVGAVDIDIVRRSVVQVHREPVFGFGPAGSFYENGVSIGCCYEAGGRSFMLFMGWQHPPGQYWRGEIGRLEVAPDLSLRLIGDQPLMAVDATDPWSLSYPWVWRSPAGDYRMWYGSTITWDAGFGEMVHVLNGAHSRDGHRWERGGVAVPFKLGESQAFSRPTVALARNGGLEMWFSYRGGVNKTYRIGHAVSADGESWALRPDPEGLQIADEGWDSGMIEYPYVLDHRGERYMLYCGAGFGQTGFGLAVQSS